MREIRFKPDQVHFHNELNRIVKLEIENIIPQMKMFIGKKILLSNEKLSAKFDIKKLRPEPVPLQKTGNDYAKNHIVYLDVSKYSLWLKVSLCFNGGNYENNTYYCNYVEKSVYVGEISEGVLTKVLDVEKISEDYSLNIMPTVEEERAKVDKYNELLEEINKVRNSLLVKTYF